MPVVQPTTSFREAKQHATIWKICIFATKILFKMLSTVSIKKLHEILIVLIGNLYFPIFEGEVLERAVELLRLRTTFTHSPFVASPFRRCAILNINNMKHAC